MNCRLRKVLAVAYTYPPIGGAGAIRLVKFAQYLPRFGWEMVVLAPKDAPSGARWEGEVPRGEVIHTKYMDIFGPLRKRAAHLAIPREHLGPVRRHSLRTFLAWSLNEFVAVPDSRVGWYPYALREGVRRVQKGDIAVIYSSSPPETTHLVAKAIHRRTGVPWVAELRDLWTQNPFYRRSFLRLWVERWLERRVLKEADAIISVTKECCERLRKDIRTSSVYLVRNGFDPDDFLSVRPKRFSKFTIVYTGTMYYPYQDPSPLLEALKSLVSNGIVPKENIEVIFIGTDISPLKELLKDSIVSEIVSSLPKVSYFESIAIQRGANVILLLLNKRISGLLKLYEAIGSGRPILAISPDRSGEPVEILRSLGVEVVSEPREIEEMLLKLYKDYIRTGGSASDVRPESRALQFTRQEAARRLAKVLDRVSSATDVKRKPMVRKLREEGC